MRDDPIARHGEKPASPVNNKVAKPSLLKDIGFLLLKIAVIILAFILIFTFMYGLYPNKDASMVPAIKDGDLVIFYRLDKDYDAGDTVVLEFEGVRQVRRVVATAGDTVDITEDGLMVNGALQQESEIYETTHRYDNGVDFPITLSERQIFVLGDSRENAADGRVYGAVEIKDTLGKVMAVLRRRNI